MSISYKYKKHDTDEKLLVVESTDIRETAISLAALDANKAKLEYDKQVAVDAYDSRIAKIQTKINQAIALGVKEDI